MHGTIPIAPDSAADCTDSPTVKSDSEDERPWFSATCHALYPKDAGLALHLLTSVDERSCYRYAAGDTKQPPEYVLRALLRSEHGWQWLSALMEESKATWWRDLEIAREVAAVLNKHK